MNGIKVKFWGVRGSFPIPKSEDSFGGNTSCIEIRSYPNNELVLFDMGTGLRNFGNSILKEKTQISDINIVLSHFHYDHILGFLMFIPLFVDKFNVNIFAPGESDQEIKTKFGPLGHGPLEFGKTLGILENPRNWVETLGIGLKP